MPKLLKFDEAARRGLVFGSTSDPQQIRRLLDMNVAALFHDLNDPLYHDEIAHWFRCGEKEEHLHRDGLSARCMNMPARYANGFLGDIGVPPPYGPMDFAAWFEAFLDGQWYTFDPRNNVPRIGRVLIARGRDAADVAISNSFGPNTLASFKVWTDEVRTA